MSGQEPEDDLSSETEELELNDEHNEFLLSLHSVRLARERPGMKEVHQAVDQRQAAVRAEAANIYLDKELKAACGGPHLQTEEGLDRAITKLHQCNVNKAAVEFAATNTLINAKLQTGMQQMFAESSGENLSPALMSVLYNSRQSLEVSAELSARLENEDKKRQQRLEQRLKLTELYKEVLKLWQDKQQRDLARERTSDTPLIKELRQKLREKEGRVQLLVHFLKSMLTGLTPGWGSNQHTVKILQACELVVTNGSSADVTAVADLLKG